jgi:hypothetical protein
LSVAVLLKWVVKRRRRYGETVVGVSEDNVDKLRTAYQLWNDTRGGSAGHWLGLMADDVVMRSLADGADGMEFTRGRRGKAEAEQYFSGLADD